MEQDIFEHSLRLINKYGRKTAKPCRYGTDDLLYAAEVHMITAIGIHENITVTGLAELTGITKGAVSQTLSKLSDKSLIEKHISEKRRTEVKISLTEKGRQIFRYHQDMHSITREKIYAQLDTLDDKAMETIVNIINELDNMLDEL
ncbi:MAG: winged helix-turn-helix transcriptional regulator [Oscillospiraceae bacterium]|nr:winged helix-turn-helix transcriptional regulator [Oscillospiraceae bacterium]